jgi:hypothetical protein
VVGELLTHVPTAPGALKLTDSEISDTFDLADLITRGRTAVERDYQGNPSFAHALEMPTRLAKQLVQLARGGLALGMSHDAAMAVVARCAADTMPPLRFKALVDVAAKPNSTTADVVDRLQMPRKTVDRTLQELHLLELLVVRSVTYGDRTRWLYSLAEDVSRDALEKLARNVSSRTEDSP